MPPIRKADPSTNSKFDSTEPSSDSCTTRRNEESFFALPSANPAKETRSTLYTGWLHLTKQIGIIST